jgi:hypothetical protein
MRPFFLSGASPTRVKEPRHCADSEPPRFYPPPSILAATKCGGSGGATRPRQERGLLDGEQADQAHSRSSCTNSARRQCRNGRQCFSGRTVIAGRVSAFRSAGVLVVAHLLRRSWRIDFSRAQALLMASGGSATSMSFLRRKLPFSPWPTRAESHLAPRRLPTSRTRPLLPSSLRSRLTSARETGGSTCSSSEIGQPTSARSVRCRRSKALFSSLPSPRRRVQAPVRAQRSDPASEGGPDHRRPSDAGGVPRGRGGRSLS